MTQAPHAAEDVATIGSQLTGWPVESATVVRGGGNNRVYRLSGAGRTAALKFYPLQHEDPRDRLEQEFSALTFISGHGFSDVPKPLARDDSNRCAIYEWIEGVSPGQASTADVDALADFFIRLQTIRQLPAASELAAASASCFSPAMVSTQLEERLRRLREVVPTGSEASAFLNERLARESTRQIASARDHCRRAGIAYDEELPPSRWVLSPSDFGLHNVLRQQDGRLVFIDFEYFGWDDPAKAVADVMVHPGTTLSSDLAVRYRSRVEAALRRTDPLFATRLEVVVPLIALTWCVILLNEFLPERWVRRTLAGQAETRGVIQARQLAKAQNLFGQRF